MIVLRNGLVDAGAGEFARADVIVDDDRIHSVVETAPACGVSVNCTNYAIVPGMVTTYSSADALRGTADEIYLRALLAGIELLRSGATTVVDVRFDGDGPLEPVVRAYRHLGLRVDAGDGAERGRIEPGRRADLVLLELKPPVPTQLNDPLKQLAVDSVMVGGEWRLVNGRIKPMDEAAVLAAGRARGVELDL